MTGKTEANKKGLKKMKKNNKGKDKEQQDLIDATCEKSLKLKCHVVKLWFSIGATNELLSDKIKVKWNPENNSIKMKLLSSQDRKLKFPLPIDSYALMQGKSQPNKCCWESKAEKMGYLLTFNSKSDADLFYNFVMMQNTHTQKEECVSQPDLMIFSKSEQDASEQPLQDIGNIAINIVEAVGNSLRNTPPDSSSRQTLL